MRAQMPIDPMPNPQDPKDALHSHGDSGLMPYVSAWELLPDAITRVTVGGRSKDMAEADLCRAIADGAVRIRGKLRKHATRHMTSNMVLQGTDFRISPEIKPADLDWKSSRPLEPWIVRRDIFRLPGSWHLEWIQVCRTDVTKTLCAAKEQGETTRHASSETPATSTSRSPLESQQMPGGRGPSSTAGPRKPNAEPARRRGARPQKFEQAKDAMRNDIQHGRHTAAQLDDMLEKNLATNYGVSRDTARKARKAVLSELNSRQFPTNDK